MKNVKNRSKFHEKMAVFSIILPWMASYGSERSFLLMLSARDDLVKFHENQGSSLLFIFFNKAKIGRFLTSHTAWPSSLSIFSIFPKTSYKNKFSHAFKCIQYFLKLFMKAKYWADNALWSPPGAAIVWLSPLPHGWRHKRSGGGARWKRGWNALSL